MNKTITIAGAGLSGLSAGINLARAGHKVRIYEKKSVIAQSPLENPQLLPNWFQKEDVLDELKECGVNINPVCEIKKIKIHLPRGKVIFYSRKKPVGYTVLRGGENSLEKDLATQAIKAGVEIVFNKAGSGEEDILATGSGKTITVGYGQVYKGSFNPTETQVFFDPDYSESIGYAYLFPHSEKLATFKLSKQAGEKGDLRKKLESIRLEKLGETLKKDNLIGEFGTKRSFEIPKTAIHGKSILIGEQAGFQDELFRFGMRYAIISGFLAARAIVKEENYDELWKNRFLPEFKKNRLVRKFFCFVKKEKFLIFPNREIRINIELFKSIWLSPVFERALRFF